MISYQVSRCNAIGFKLLLSLVLLLVTWQALTPLPVDAETVINDKLGHLLVFLMLAAISDHAFAATHFSIKKIAYLMIYGIGLECLQYFVPGREFSFLDMLANASGLFIYWALMYFIFQRQISLDNKT